MSKEQKEGKGFGGCCDFSKFFKADNSGTEGEDHDKGSFLQKMKKACCGSSKNDADTSEGDTKHGCC